MPYVFTDNDQYEFARSKKNEPLSEMEIYIFGEQFKARKPAVDGFALTQFLANECKKPIEFSMQTKSGEIVQTKLDGDKPMSMLKDHKVPFDEAGRNINSGGHLMAFCIKNGMTVDELIYLKDHPGTKKAEEIQVKLDNARKDFMEVACCENESLIEEKTTNFYVEYIKNAKNELEKIKAMPAGPDRTERTVGLCGNYYSIGFQTLKLGYDNNPFGKKIEANVNARIKADGGQYTFNQFFSFGMLMNSIYQTSKTLEDAAKNVNEDPAKDFFLRERSELLNSLALQTEYLDELFDIGKNMDEIYAAMTEEVETELAHRVGSGDKYNGITTQSANDSGISLAASQDFILDRDINKHGGPVPDEDLDAQLDQLLSEAKKSDSRNFTSIFKPTQSNKRFFSMIEAAENLKVLREKGADPEQLEIGYRELQCAANEYVRFKDDVDPTAKTNAGNRKRIGEKFMSLAGSRKLALQGKLEKSIEKYKAQIDRNAANISKDWVNLEANFTPYKEEPQKPEAPKAPKAEEKTGLEYAEKLEKRSADKMLDPSTSSSDLKKSLATMMACKTVQEKIAVDGPKMSEQEKAMLGSKDSLKNITATLYKSDSFNEMCESLSDAQIKDLAADPKEMDKQYSKLKELSAKPVEVQKQVEHKVEKSAERIM